MQMHTSPVASRSASSFDEAMAGYAAAVARFRSLPETLEEDEPERQETEVQRLIAASRFADAAMPTSWCEFGRWVEHLSDDGANTIDDDNAERLLAHVRRLLTPAVSPAVWDAALAAYKQAEATMYEYDRTNPDDTEGLSDANADACAEAAERLLSLPAPHDAALAWKLDYLFAPDANGGSAAYAHRFIKQTLDDAVRLASAGQPSALA